MGIKKNKIVKESFMDSVFLMQTASELEKKEGIISASLMMGTDANKEILRDSNLLTAEGDRASGNDLIIAVNAEKEDEIEKALEFIQKSFEDSGSAKGEEEYRPPSLEGALDLMPGANFALISTPGRYAASQALKALREGLNVMIFSDNVPLDDEIKIKSFAREKNLLAMGPDCGTAIINRVPLGFANSIPAGDIGIGAASGSGLQELTVTVAKCGAGITQAIGTGGRDLSKEVGGKSMLSALELLDSDEETKIIVLLSKPPHPEVASAILKKASESSKPMVVCFLGSRDQNYPAGDNIRFVSTIEDAAIEASRLSVGNKIFDFEGDEEKKRFNRMVEEASSSLSGKYIRGLYAGGTLCDEAIDILAGNGIRTYSNVFSEGKYSLKDPEKSRRHTLIDMGEDFFTRGRPHPMIDLTLRNRRIQKEASDKDTGVILLDFVLGFGAQPDPAGETARVLEKIRDKGKIIVASVCGTDEDPQNAAKQKEILANSGVYLMPTNGRAAAFAGELVKRNLT